jgi:anti-sigma regulatory factor (Ser/Thr protein kinase)
MSGAPTQDFPVDSRGLAAADEWLEQIGETLEVSKSSLMKARLCVAEIGANLLEHGGGSASDAFTVSLSRAEDRLEVEFADRGLAFDPSRQLDVVAPNTAEAAKIGGLGLHLLQAMTSHVEYRRDGAWNRVRLWFPIAA